MVALPDQWFAVMDLVKKWTERRISRLNTRIRYRPFGSFGARLPALALRLRRVVATVPRPPAEPS